jgi:hypothetical protein
MEGSAVDVDRNIGSVTHLDRSLPIATDSVLVLGAYGAPFGAIFEEWEVFEVPVVIGLLDRGHNSQGRCLYCIPYQIGRSESWSSVTG